MKVLLQFATPFSLVHGGAQTQIEQTKKCLEAVGVEVDYMRWWEDAQSADIIHCFERAGKNFTTFAQKKGIKVIVAPLLTGMGSRSQRTLFVQKNIFAVSKKILPSIVTAPFGWDSFKMADACIALTAWEKHLMSYVFNALPQNVYVVPNGVENAFFESLPQPRGPWLVCTATITERKRVLELAQAAVIAQTPVWIIGKPYAGNSSYVEQFEKLARENPNIVRYEGPVQDRQKLAKIYREARGFVLLSTMESLSLSALEAAACECPLLLSDLPWARTVFEQNVKYCSITSPGKTAGVLRRFYNEAATLKPPAKPLSWVEVGKQFKRVYEQVLSTSR